MSTVTPLSAEIKEQTFSSSVMVCLWQLFLILQLLEDEADLQLKTWPLYHMSTFQMLSEVSGDVGVSEGSLHWSSTSGKRDRREHEAKQWQQKGGILLI